VTVSVAGFVGQAVEAVVKWCFSGSPGKGGLVEADR
jgi:hypothetical protein